MTKPAPPSPARHLRASDARGLAQLATQATLGVTGIVEGVHQAVWSSMSVPGGKAPGQTRGLTAVVYQAVRGATRLVGKGLDVALGKLQPLLESAQQATCETPEREAVLAALNGVLGDRLLASGSPFATRMSLRCQGRELKFDTALEIPAAQSKVLLLIHGLCMNDLQWRAQQGADALDAGATLAHALGCSALYLRYNSGLHVSQNGHALALQLEQVLTHWPVPLEEITVVAHSMGGLLIRSALHCARQDGLGWPDRLKNIVFLGTPHHGAPLERAGNWIDVILGSTAYSAPFARLGQLRSAGITDLRYGFALDSDWQGHDRFRRKPDRRAHLALPQDVACYAVAATTRSKRSALADRLVGDGLVPLHSALGQHDDARRNLNFARERQWIAYRTGHLALLTSPAVTQQILRWLRPAEHEPELP